MSREELLALADRVEQATAEQQADILWEAFRAVHGEKPPRVQGGSAEMDAYLAKSNPFFHMVEAKAFESAAMSLIPEGWGLTDLTNVRVRDAKRTCYARLCCFEDYKLEPTGDAETLALSLVSASLRARAAMGEGL